MSNWELLNKARVKTGSFASKPEDGFNGYFCIQLNGLPVKIIASDGEGWQHVSVSIADSAATPSWQLMCKVKDLFWDEEDCVVQFHPPKSTYVNCHPGCLHLWKAIGVVFPTPDPLMVGPKA